MKVYEIVKEDRKTNNNRQRVDEVAPLVLPILGTVTIGGLLTAVTAVLTAMDIVEIYKLSKKLATEPDKMTDDDYMTLFVDVLFMLPLLRYAPGVVKRGIARMIPDSWKKEGGKKVKDIIDSKRSKDIDPKTGKPKSKTKDDPSDKYEIDPKTGRPKLDPKTGKPIPKAQSSSIGNKIKGGAAGAATYLGYDALTGGDLAKRGYDAAKDKIGGAIDSATGGRTNLSGKKDIDGNDIDKDDPLYQFSRWFGRVK